MLATIVVVKVNAEHTFESRSKLCTHGAVEDEVRRTVDENENVPDVAERYVDVVEDSLVNGAGQCQHALRQFGEDERQHDHDQHRRRTSVADVAGRSCRRRGTTTSHETEARFTTIGAKSHGPDQQRTEHGQQRARRHFEHHAVQPEDEHLHIAEMSLCCDVIPSFVIFAVFYV